MKFNEINRDHNYGRLLIAALAKLSGTMPPDTETDPDALLAEVEKLAGEIYKDEPLAVELENAKTFEQLLATAINKFSKENDSNTPDFILAEYLKDCLDLFAKTSKAREKWYGKELKII